MTKNQKMSELLKSYDPSTPLRGYAEASNAAGPATTTSAK